VISIGSIKEIEGTSETTLTTSQYLLDSRVGFIKRIVDNNLSRWFIGLDENSRIEVEFTAGYANVPVTIQHVCYELIAERYNRKKSGNTLNFGKDVQRVSIPGTISIDFDYSLQSNERSQKYGMFIGNYANVLDPFRSERALVGKIKEVHIA
jgi:hypothetical protein